ncbi:MAG: GNAT family N-acetyltransferase [Oceanospirillaceae bacterium]|nr:GNAT family N-acetyltransferase [Oceanospirillaceae bacterium]
MSVITYALQMKSLSQLRAKDQPDNFKIVEAQLKEYKFNRFLYQLVGENWQWTDKLKWPDSEWQTWAESDNLRTWVGYYQGSIAGYYELEQQVDGNVELAYFGLASNFIGKGLGGYLLSEAIKSAWSIEGTRRVWVHTCSLDHPSALANYQARGFEIYSESVES